MHYIFTVKIVPINDVLNFLRLLRLENPKNSRLTKLRHYYGFQLGLICPYLQNLTRLLPITIEKVLGDGKRKGPPIQPIGQTVADLSCGGNAELLTFRSI